MKDDVQVINRIHELIEEGGHFADEYDFIGLDPKGSLELQTWLGQALLVIESVLPPRHPFHKQAAAYLAGAGQLGAQGMLALLRALEREIKLGTLG